MNESYQGVIAQINLSNKHISFDSYGEDFFRTYLGGGAIGTYFLLERTDAGTDPLGADNCITIAPGLTTGPAVSGASRCSVTALSPETSAVGDSQAGGNFGPFLKRCGFDALVITGISPDPCSIEIRENSIEIKDAAELVGLNILDAHDRLKELAGVKSEKISIIQCGPAGERLVRYANLASDLQNFYGRTGLGAVFGSKNLRAVTVSGSGSIQIHAPERIKALAKQAAGRVTDSGFVSTLKKYGTPGLVNGNAQAGNLCTHNYSTGYHPDYENISGEKIHEQLASKPGTCYGCVVGCRKTIKNEGKYPITDRLGGPEFETLGVLGPNLDILDPMIIGKANELCNSYGIDTITFGGLMGYLFEAIEKGLIKPETIGIPDAGFGSGESLLRLIELTGERTGIGEILAQGFEACIDYFGEETRACAVQVKNHGFAAHMAQVKPSMALIYAVSPIGADHMSCEHDWLLAEDGEGAKGLGITKSGDPLSTGIDKVRMVLYTQYYYSVLDSLNLCMFCWGAGNLFEYQDLEELVYAVTGMRMTFWELLKAGERRIHMMRLLNIRRGFTSDDDALPQKVFTPLIDGPSKGFKVDPAAFEKMKSLYYELIGWDRKGVPLASKRAELNIAWKPPE